MAAAVSPKRRSGGLSITAGLAVFYTLSVSLLLLFSTGFLYFSVTHTLELDDQHLLSAKIHSIRTILGEHADDPGLRLEELMHEVVWEGGVYAPGQHSIFFTRILDQQGGVMIQTPGMAELIPTSIFPPPMAIAEKQAELHGWRSSAGRDYWVVSALGRTEDGRLKVIQVAFDDTVEETLLRNYQSRSVAVLVFGTLLFATIGIYFIHRRMRPLREMALAAKRITPSHLHERLDPSQWPRELRTVAEGFNVMLDGLEESFARLSRFSSELAHEMRTPIHILMNDAEAGLSAERTPEEYREILESNLEEYNRLARLINGLLFLARAEDPRTRIEPVPIDVREELEAVRDFHEVLAEDQGVTIECEGEARMDADRTLFRSAITNLVSNALRHTPEGGRIVLAISRPDDGQVVVSIRDTGPGMAPEVLPRVFDRFYRSEAGRAFAEGTGLGLAIAKSIVELHGGTIGVESAPGKGTTFILRFPASIPGAG
ncbi:MAG TPA: heavy metal sensor histidine kinase [Burkholderiales bacterium]|nr:heavy metal sensor histidine kinase [Burkholderiales bacterium]